MDQVLAQAKVEVSPTSKAWEPQRAYEKRLSAIMSKEKRLSFFSITSVSHAHTQHQAQNPKRQAKVGKTPLP